MTAWRTYLLFAACTVWGASCATSGNPPPGAASPPGHAQNSIFVAADNEVAVWERTVDVIHSYFEIQRENRLDGVIELQPKPGASVFEPWQRDTVGTVNRMESTLQSIRRRGQVTITPTRGGYLVSVEIFKELEDLPGVAANTAGGASFQTYNPLQRDLNLVVGQTTPSGWIILGRDEAIEQRMLQGLQREFSR